MHKEYGVGNTHKLYTMGPCLSRVCTPPASPPSNVFASTAPATTPSQQPPKPLRARRGRSRRPWWRRARSAAIQDEDVWSARVTKAAAEDVEEVERPSPVPGSGSRLLLPEGGCATRIWV